MIMDHAALRVLAARTARRTRATLLMILTTLWSIGGVVNDSKSGGAKKHDRGG
jgi:hypothetical protein